MRNLYLGGARALFHRSIFGVMLSNLTDFFAHRAEQAREDDSRCFSAVVGYVTDNSDPEKKGRVRVRFPHLNHDQASYWLPISSMGAGPARGWYFLPEIDEEVLVMFEAGHLNAGVVLGAVWSTPEQAQADLPDPASTTIKTIASRKGSRVILDDDAAELILESSDGKARIVLSDEKIALEADQGDISIQTDKGELDIRAQEISLEASSEVVMSGQSVEIHGTVKSTVKAPQIKLKPMIGMSRVPVTKVPKQPLQGCDPKVQNPYEAD